MTDRTPVPDAVQTLVLTRSARRCALCFGLYGDLTERRGQIAHLDHDSGNNAADNLTYLCLDHHDQYDSRTSQSKGIKEAEVKTYRERLYRAVETGLPRATAPEREAEAQRSAAVIAHDTSIFQRADDMLSEAHINELLAGLQSDDSLLRKDLHALIEFREFFRIRGNHYLHSDLVEPVTVVLRAITDLLAFTGQHFFLYPRQPLSDQKQYCLHPALNIDREGTGEPGDVQRYSALQEQLDERCKVVRTSYRAYRLAIKSTLLR